MLPARSSPPRVSALSSRVPVPTSSVVLPVLVCSPSTTRPSSSSSARSTRVDLVKRPSTLSDTLMDDVEGGHGRDVGDEMHSEVDRIER